MPKQVFTVYTVNGLSCYFPVNILASRNSTSQETISYVFFICCCLSFFDFFFFLLAWFQGVVVKGPKVTSKVNRVEHIWK